MAHTPRFGVLVLPNSDWSEILRCSKHVEDLGFDTCLDYKAGDLSGQLGKAVPEGIDVAPERVEPGDGASVGVAEARGVGVAVGSRRRAGGRWQKMETIPSQAASPISKPARSREIVSIPTPRLRASSSAFAAEDMPAPDPLPTPTTTSARA